jgi:hypothetical protein
MLAKDIYSHNFQESDSVAKYSLRALYIKKVRKYIQSKEKRFFLFSLHNPKQNLM